MTGSLGNTASSHEVNAPAPCPGMRVAGYTLVSALGTGGMGRVFVAEDDALSRRVALKVLPPEDADDEARARFVREAQALARVQHRNVVQVFASGVDDGLAWMALELVAGDPLGAVVGSAGLDEETALSLCAQAARGLAAAHAAGVVHRDVKPDNLILDETAVLRVVDFGVALLVEGGRGGFVTQKGVAVGTPHFMAPEQARGGAVDARADAWGLGATLFALLAGQPPFFRHADEPDLDILARVLRERAPDVRERAPAVSAATAQVVARMLEPDAARRLADMEEIAAVLDALADAVASGQAPALLPASQPQVDDGGAPGGASVATGDVTPTPAQRPPGPPPSRLDAPGRAGLAAVALSFAGIGALSALLVARAWAPAEGAPADTPRPPAPTTPAPTTPAPTTPAPTTPASTTPESATPGGPPTPAPVATTPQVVVRALPIDVLPPPAPPPTAEELAARALAQPDDVATWRALVGREDEEARDAVARLAAVPGAVGDAAVSTIADLRARSHLAALRAAAVGPHVPRARRAIDLLVTLKPYEALEIFDEVERVQTDDGLKAHAASARRTLFRVDP